MKRTGTAFEWLCPECSMVAHPPTPLAKLIHDLLYASAHMQFETATHQVVEWLPVRISLGPGFDWLHEAKWVENDEQVQWPALSWVGPSPCL